MNITVVNQKKIVAELREAQIAGIELSELISEKGVTYREIKNFMEDVDNEVDTCDEELFEKISKKYEKTKKSVDEPASKKETKAPKEKDSSDSEKETKAPKEKKDSSDSEKVPKEQTKPILYTPTSNNDFPEIGFSNISSQQLKDTFGAPEESEDPTETGYRYIYNFKIGNIKYELYDKADENDQFDEEPETIEWYASSKGSMKVLRKAFNVLTPYDELEELETDYEFTTEQLNQKSQRITNPLPEEFKEWRYGYYLLVGTKTFFVYDMANEQDEWDAEDDIEWFIRGDGAVKTLIKSL
jgi:hypothetical protein